MSDLIFYLKNRKKYYNFNIKNNKFQLWDLQQDILDYYFWFLRVNDAIEYIVRSNRKYYFNFMKLKDIKKSIINLEIAVKSLEEIEKKYKNNKSVLNIINDLKYKIQKLIKINDTFIKENKNILEEYQIESLKMISKLDFNQAIKILKEYKLQQSEM